MESHGFFHVPWYVNKYQGIGSLSNAGIELAHREIHKDVTTCTSAGTRPNRPEESVRPSGPRQSWGGRERVAIGCRSSSRAVVSAPAPLCPKKKKLHMFHCTGLWHQISKISYLVSGAGAFQQKA